MIKAIHIENFQSHKNTDIELCDGINIFTGTSDSGKSAIIRSLEWVTKNRPLGEEFRSNWGGDTCVDLATSEGQCITREKGKDGNLYAISSYKGTPPLEFKAFGTSVPDEIQRELKLSDINFQFQLDPLFLITQSPGEVAITLNKVVGLENIDTSISYMNKKIGQCKSEYTRTKDQLIQIKNELTQFEALDLFDTELKELENSYSIFLGKKEKAEKINSILEKYHEIKTKLNQIREMTTLETSLNICIGINNRIIDNKSLIGEIELIIKSIANTQNKINRLKTTVELEQECLALAKGEAKLATKREKIGQISSLIINIRSLASKLESMVKKKDALVAEFEKEMPDICPLCGSKKGK